MNNSYTPRTLHACMLQPEYGRLATFTNLPQIYKLAPSQICRNSNLPQIQTRPTFLCMVSDVSAWFVLVVFNHRSNVYLALQVMFLVNKRRDRSMLCVLSHVNNAIELYYSLIVERYSKALRAYSGWPGCIEVLLLSIIIFVF